MNSKDLAKMIEEREREKTRVHVNESLKCFISNYMVLVGISCIDSDDNPDVIHDRLNAVYNRCINVINSVKKSINPDDYMKHCEFVKFATQANETELKRMYDERHTDRDAIKLIIDEIMKTIRGEDE